ncbi:DNA topoisomerase 3-beta-1-like [Halichondria panicea]|uniref:DNA topoisomerase 3-beta-1-like n=1 Tax=Halichondria panicea TaxID=6063 RepID=UPI00312BC411
MSSVLMVAEKPSLARSLAEILSKKSCNRRKTMCSACDVYEWTGHFPALRGAARFKMTSVCGHVMGLDFPAKYNRWDQVDPIELFDVETEKKESIPNLRMRDFLRSEGQGVDSLVLWLDCDKEGENICFEVIDEVKPVMRRGLPDSQVIWRAKFSAITEGAISQAFNSLGSPNWDQARSVDGRMELDLRVGCAFTRFQTKAFQSKYTGLNNSVISYGPCQTPTLGFCVQRHDEIMAFKSEKYWKLSLKVKHGSAVVTLDWSADGVFDHEVGHLLLSLVRDHTHALVVGVAEKPRSKAPPIALNTVELLRVASSRLHIGPKSTMDMAERLYIEGFISYPRTETTSYPEGFDFQTILNDLKRHTEFAEYTSSLLSIGVKVPSSGRDVGDHPPITPMRSATRAQMRDSDWRLYDYITRHFLATLSPDCKYKQTQVDFALGREAFSWSGLTPVSPGYTAIYSWHAIESSESTVKFEKGQCLEVAQLKLAEHQTTPPGYLTESELISLMEKHAIGTDASIAVHIENITTRNYVHVDSGRRLIPTKLGIVLVHGYQKIDPELVLPTIRAAVEEQLEQIALGKADYSVVVTHALDIFRRKFAYFESNIDAMDELFEASFSSVAESGRPLSKCGLCRRYLKYISSRPQRLYCAQCDQTYSLPQGGSIKLYKEIKCPLDEFELLLFTSVNGRKSYLVCPYCYNEPPFKAVSGGMSCSVCPHESCPHAKPQHRVERCSECENGVLVLEPHWQTGGTPKWKISCNSSKCKEVYVCFAGSTDVSSSPEVCPHCDSNLLSVDLTKVPNLPEAEGKHTGCWQCDPLLSELVTPFDARTDRPRPRHTGGRRGRGRRGRDRGRR